MKKYKLLLPSVVAVFLLSTILGGPGVLANSLNDLKKEHKQLEQKQNQINSNINTKKKEIAEKKTTIEKILDQISKLNGEIEETNQNIARIKEIIEVTKEEIAELRLSIEDLEKKIAERDVVLRERVRAMQVKGNSVNYIDVLLGANSFADFIDRFSAVNTLMDADRKIMDQQARDIEQLEKEKALVEQKLAEQVANKKKLEGMRASLESQKKQKNNLINQLEKEQEKLENEKGQLEEELHETHEVSKEVEQKIIAEQKRLAEIARKAEEERKRREAAARAAARAGQKNSGGGGSYTPPPAVASGTWTKPASGRFTSGFGYRIHPISGTKRQHRGADIANSIGTPVVAAGDGVVSYAGTMGTYGNVIMITHSVDGQIFTTLYAHLSSIGVSSGQHVEKGQYIAGLGNTGGSTGPHLHFEFHIGNWSASGPSAVNPLRYVPF
ncbi:peptidoglycan DD-metalloendopeptidase family protein [Sporosarcina sp. 179-K 3D1 HS]|uniref:murein hydrolase activator EnvC family protein n=1 Tax=Sporosarcina sp. 179-K 3D1 HS TaxID=3232169 RepID=UPI0039A1D5C8